MQHFRKTKIIATFGPAIADEKTFAKTVQAGVNVIRFNFSHLSPNDARRQIQWVKQQLKKIKYNVAFLGDLKGPEIRTDFEHYKLSNNQEVYFCSTKEKQAFIKKNGSQSTVIGIDHPKLYNLVKKGQDILVDDGEFAFKVIKVKEKMIHLQVIQEGTLKPNKSVIVPGVDIDLPMLNRSDKDSLKVIIEEKFAWIASSFVSSAKNVEEIRNFVKKYGGDIPIISKIENQKGVNNIDEILEASQGVMVARGDLGLEFPFEQVPILQEQIINKAKKSGLVTIIATQMLNSMIENPRPSRPEVSDISYAVRSRVDAVMLSGETASGKYPTSSVASMARIVSKSESFYDDQELTYYHNTNRLGPFCEMAIRLAFKVKANTLIAISIKGKSALFLSAFRANLVNIVASKSLTIYYRNFLYYSIYPILMSNQLTEKSELFTDIINQCKHKKYLKRKNKFIHIFTHESDRVSKKFELSTNSIREEIVE